MSQETLKVFGDYNAKIREEVQNFDPKKDTKTHLAVLFHDVYRLSTIQYDRDGRITSASTFELEADLLEVRATQQLQKIKDRANELKTVPREKLPKLKTELAIDLTGYGQILEPLVIIAKRVKKNTDNDPLLEGKRFDRLIRLNQGRLDNLESAKIALEGSGTSVFLARHLPLIVLLVVEPQRTKDLKRVRKLSGSYIQRLDRRLESAKKESKLIEQKRLKEEIKAVSRFYESLKGYDRN